MKNAIVVFTKVPQAGETKTRLTEKNGGIFTPEEAKQFYEACLLDVIDSCIASACGDVYICYNRAGDGNYLRKILQENFAEQAIKEVFADEGKTFDCGMQYAFDYVLKGGGEERLADSAVIVGGDSPCLQPTTMQDAFRKLEALARSPKALDRTKQSGKSNSEIGAAIVISIDQEGGFNLIGYTHTTPFTFDGVFYNQEGITALDLVAYKAGKHSLPLTLVEMVPDVDLPVDLGSLIPVLNTLKIAQQYDSAIVAPRRTIQILEYIGVQTTAEPQEIID